MPRIACPVLEVMEPRTLLSAATLMTDTLHVVADKTVATQVLVKLDDAGENVLVEHGPREGAKLTESFPRSEVRHIIIRGSSGDDILELAADVPIRAKIFGGRGDDSIVGGAVGDLLFGQDGNDTIVGNAGNDRIHGGRGHDVLLGGEGDDRIWGGLGNDSIDGGDGNDQLWANKGSDTVLGGDGNDRLFGKKGDVLDGGEGVNRIVAKGVKTAKPKVPKK